MITSELKPLERYRPLLSVSDTLTPELVGVKRRQRIEMILNYRVVEITKSYTILEINYVSRVNTSRAV